MTRRFFGGRWMVAGAALGIVGLAGCGGGGGYSSSPSAPTPVTTPTPTGASTTIAIVGIAGAQSFNPDPANIANGSTFAFKNSDGVMHRIVFDDGTIDSGNLAPGASSGVMTLRSNTARYHCTIHPSMVGSINTAAPNAPPCVGAYCDSK